jgi:zinc transport system substrate-binding protein
MIECAVRAVAGDELLVHRLTPPGQCPGHFDLKPGDFEAIVQSEVLLRHDYQEYFDSKLQASAGRKRIVSLPTTGPQTIPPNYAQLCRDVASGLCEAFPELSPAIERNLATVEASLDSIASRTRREAAPLAGAVVIASGFQKDFCEWLGLRVVGDFDQAQEMSLKDLERLVRVGRDAHAVAVVGNLQRGDREGKPIAQRLDVPLVLLSNYPLRPEAADAYAQLINSNVQQLLEGCRDVSDR